MADLDINHFDVLTGSDGSGVGLTDIAEAVTWAQTDGLISLPALDTIVVRATVNALIRAGKVTRDEEGRVWIMNS